MMWSILKKDIIRNRTMNTVVFLFMLLAASLAMVSILLAVQTFTSISNLYDAAKPPHFVQMHKGDINKDEIMDFLSQHDAVTNSHIMTMIDVHGSDIQVMNKKSESYSLADIRLDIGMVKQNSEYDLLLNANHETVHLQTGEIGIPVLLKEMYNIEIGDSMIFSSANGQQIFVVKAFILDSMMNSSMVSSTRILISDSDYNAFIGQSVNQEHLICAYFNDPNMAKSFQTDYENSGLPQSGQAVTYSIIFLLSALSDITTVFILLLVSLVLIIVSFICVRFTILAALEVDIQQLGTMKAIGIGHKDMRNMYLRKYEVIASIAVIFGFLLALLLSKSLTQHISNTFGLVSISLQALAFTLSAGVFVFLVITMYSRHVLNRIRKISVVEALVNQRGVGSKQVVIRDDLHLAANLPVNWLMALREVVYQSKNWLTIGIVVLCSVVMILIPINVRNTFEAPEFITYMGSSLEDILIEIEPGEELELHYVRVKELLEADNRVANYSETRRIRVQTNTTLSPMNLTIDAGLGAGEGLQYLEGHAPSSNYEVALSYLNATELNKSVGQTIEIQWDEKSVNFVVSGIYQDVTSGGYTAKAFDHFRNLDAEKHSFSINLASSSNAKEIASQWSELLGKGISVDPMKEFIHQTLGGVSNQLLSIVIGIACIGLLLTCLITILFLRLRIFKDRSTNAILKAIGFTSADIQLQYLIKVGCIAFAGVTGGIIITSMFGNQIVNLVLRFAGLGITRIQLIPAIALQFVVCPIVTMVLVLLVTKYVSKPMKRHSILSMIKE